MKLKTILERIEAQSTIEDFMTYMEDSIKKGTSTNNIAKNSPVKLGPIATKQLLDLWFPGYDEMSIPEKRQWVVSTWPLLNMERNANWKFHMMDPTHPIYKYFTNQNIVNYHGQKHAAKNRGIEFKFDFLTWVVWWVNTGHFDERGVKMHDYQMCRIGDTGNYEWNNVYCDTAENNKRDYHEVNKLS